MHAIGIDMAKDTFHAAFDDRTVMKFENTPAGIEEFMTILEDGDFPITDTRIVVEATGVYHLLFAVTLREHSWDVAVINPLESHRMMTKQRRDVHRLKEAATGFAFYDSFTTVLEALSEEIKHIERSMRGYETETQELLRSIPGVGSITAAILVAFIGDINRFATPEKLVAYIGLDCRVYQSGTSVHGKGYISKRGNGYLRHMLFNAAFVARRRNPDLKSYHEQKLREGKHYFSALCAVERKLVHLIYAVWKRGTPFVRRSQTKTAGEFSPAVDKV